MLNLLLHLIARMQLNITTIIIIISNIVYMKLNIIIIIIMFYLFTSRTNN